MNNQIQKAQRNYDLDEAASLQYGELPKLQNQLAAEEERVKNQDLSLVHESVTDEEIARIISRWTGIPVAKLTEVREVRFCTWKMNCTRESSDRMRVSPG